MSAKDPQLVNKSPDDELTNSPFNIDQDGLDTFKSDHDELASFNTDDKGLDPITLDHNGLDPNETFTRSDSQSFSNSSTKSSRRSKFSLPIDAPECAIPSPLFWPWPSSQGVKRPFPAPQDSMAEFSVAPHLKRRRESSSGSSSVSDFSISSDQAKTATPSISGSPTSLHSFHSESTACSASWTGSSLPSPGASFPSSHRFIHRNSYPTMRRVKEKRRGGFFRKTKTGILTRRKVHRGNLESWTDMEDLEANKSPFPELEARFQSIENLLNRLCGPTKFHDVKLSSGPTISADAIDNASEYDTGYGSGYDADDEPDGSFTPTDGMRSMYGRIDRSIDEPSEFVRQQTDEEAAFWE